MKHSSYPFYVLKTVGKDGKRTLHRFTHKRTFLNSLNGLSQLRMATFKVLYAPNSCNESIDYTTDQFDQLRKDVRIFTAKAEIDSCME